MDDKIYRQSDLSKGSSPIDLIGAHLGKAENMFRSPDACTCLEDIIGFDEISYNFVPHAIEWIPRGIDIKRIATICKIVSAVQDSSPLKIADIAGRNGFFARLLEQKLKTENVPLENIDVVDPDRKSLLEAIEFYKGTNTLLKFRPFTSKEYADADFKTDIAICSWMLPGMNLRPDIERLKPKVIILARDQYDDVGVHEAFEPSDDYEVAVCWNGPTALDAMYFLQQKISLTFEKSNTIVVLVRRDYGLRQTILEETKEINNIQESERYPWEKELNADAQESIVASSDIFHKNFKPN